MGFPAQAAVGTAIPLSLGFFVHNKGTCGATRGSRAGAGGAGEQDRPQPVRGGMGQNTVTQMKGDGLRNVMAWSQRGTGTAWLSREARLPDLPTVSVTLCGTSLLICPEGQELGRPWG